MDGATDPRRQALENILDFEPRVEIGFAGTLGAQAQHATADAPGGHHFSLMRKVFVCGNW
jgi:hypothetical protein